MRIIYIDARARFLKALTGITDPEQKRRVIGREFIKVFEHTARSLEVPIHFFVQGTLYTDVIESAVAQSGHTCTGGNCSEPAC